MRITLLYCLRFVARQRDFRVARAYRRCVACAGGRTGTEFSIDNRLSVSTFRASVTHGARFENPSSTFPRRRISTSGRPGRCRATLPYGIKISPNPRTGGTPHVVVIIITPSRFCRSFRTATINNCYCPIESPRSVRSFSEINSLVNNTFAVRSSRTIAYYLLLNGPPRIIIF